VSFFPSFLPLKRKRTCAEKVATAFLLFLLFGFKKDKKLGKSQLVNLLIGGGMGGSVAKVSYFKKESIFLFGEGWVGGIRVSAQSGRWKKC
jgi:fluoride ion exporter CrcB/FEX